MLAATLTAIFVLLGSVTSSSIWLPAESIRDEQGGIVIGYVLAESEDELVVLLEHDRHVIRIDEALVSERKYCDVYGVVPLLSDLRRGVGGNSFAGAIGLNWPTSGYIDCAEMESDDESRRHPPK